jgi:hypothetical protein
MRRLESEGKAEPFNPMGRSMSAYVQMKDATPELFAETVVFAATLEEKEPKKKKR